MPQLHRAQKLRQLIAADAHLMSLLRAARALDLPDWCIAAGAVRNLVWDTLHGFTRRNLPSDIDLLFFDAVQARDENQIERELQQLAPEVRWEAVNQATIHLYNRDRAYVSTADALSRWAETATAVGVYLTADDGIEIVAPLGLDDLFDIIARPNLQAPDAARVYRERLQSKGWQARWPRLQVLWPDEKA